MGSSFFTKALDYLQDKFNKKEITVAKTVVRNKIIYNINSKTVNIITPEGDTFLGEKIESTLLNSLKSANNEEIIKILNNNNKEELTEKELVSSFLDIFKDSKDFDIINNELYFKNIKTIPIPSIIVAKFIEILETTLTSTNNRLVLDQEYNSLLLFTAKLLTSPRKESIEQLLTFCRHNDLRITPKGNIIAYRRVNPYNNINTFTDKKLLRFVKKSVAQVKSWKKGIKNYEIYNEKGYKLIHKNKLTDSMEHIGNLYDLYNNQSLISKEEVQLYTSQHNPGRYIFAIGDIYKAEEDDIDTNASVCHSGGIHFASCNYDYSGYGSTPIVVLINPAKTITIPLNETAKGRTIEMKIACINPNEAGVHIDYELIKQADEEYDEYTLNELQQTIASKSVENISIQEEIPQLSLPEIKNITELLKTKVVKF